MPAFVAWRTPVTRCGRWLAASCIEKRVIAGLGKMRSVDCIDRWVVGIQGEAENPPFDARAVFGFGKATKTDLSMQVHPEGRTGVPICRCRLLTLSVKKGGGSMSVPVGACGSTSEKLTRGNWLSKPRRMGQWAKDRRQIGFSGSGRRPRTHPGKPADDLGSPDSMETGGRSAGRSGICEGPELAQDGDFAESVIPVARGRDGLRAIGQSAMTIWASWRALVVRREWGHAGRLWMNPASAD